MTETTSRPAEPAVPAFPSDRSCPYHPAPGYAPMGKTRPLTRVRLFDGREAWLVTGHAEGRALLADQRLSSEWGNPVFPVVVARTEGREGLSLPLIGVDDPEHARQRRMLIPSFGVKRMAAMRPVLQQEVDRLIDGILADGPTIDLVSRFALPVPSIAICMLLGVPYDDHDLFEERSRDFVGAATSAEADAAFGALYGYLFDLVRGKQEQPGEGLLDELITVQLAEGKLDHDELVKMAMVLLIAGHETTGNAISLGVLALLEHPEQLAALHADDGLLPNAIEELLRFLSVSDFIVRLAVDDIRVGDQTIKAGDGVVLSIMLMNRDGAAYEDPDTLDLRRAAGRHVGFGHGIHQCLGQNLARAELEIALGSLFTRIPTLKLAVPVDEIPISAGHDGQGPRVLPVTW